MKKKDLYLFWHTFAMFIFWAGTLPVHAQITDASQWNSFINSSANPFVSDTFRLQTFGDSTDDNWAYMLTGKTDIRDISSINIDDLGGSHALNLGFDSRISLEPFSPSLYQNIYMQVFAGGANLMKNENLQVTIYLADEVKKATLCSVTSNNASCPYSPTRIKNNPYALDIYTSLPATKTSKGSYNLQYVLAYGEIPQYSLFTGLGNWNDTTCWSHLPAERHRNALLNGEISVTTPIRCNEAFLHNGILHIGSGGSLTLNNLTFCTSDDDSGISNYSLTVQGDLRINDRMLIQKTFPETGKWYFISFPFDVYATGIDTRFQQQDATPNRGGNYLYVQFYNGEKRAADNRNTGNWEVMPIRSSSSPEPLFEKGKGYLVALDELATARTLSFSSRPGEIPEGFGHHATLSLSSSLPPTGADKSNCGWYLCGNPLPGPLALSDIEPNKSLDGNIYLYEETGYKAYPIGSDLALPPLSAFFVKATSDTEIKIKSESAVEKDQIIPCLSPLRSTLTEPQEETATHLILPTFKKIICYSKEGMLYLDGIPADGTVQVINLQGKIVWKQGVYPGSCMIRLSLPVGIYIVQVETGHYRENHKIAITR